MSFDKYCFDFKNQAKEIGYSTEKIEHFLQYASVLNRNGVPIIYDATHLSLLMGVEVEFIYKITNAQSKFYRKFTIPKKNGGTRRIAEPLPSLKGIQNWILINILNSLKPSKFTKAFQKGVSIKNNARFHQNQKCVVCMDIENYFGSIPEFKVYEFFNKLGYTEQLSGILSKLCCLNDSLPQGGCTSPALSNLITIDLDNDLCEVARLSSNDETLVRYTRYADDITFSGNNVNIKSLINSTRKMLKNHGFILKEDKTRILNQNTCQRVTGVVVNNKMQVSSKTRHRIRQNMYYISKFGLDNHMHQIGSSESKVKFVRKLLGEINFVIHINPSDAEFKEYKKSIIDLLVSIK